MIISLPVKRGGPAAAPGEPTDLISQSIDAASKYADTHCRVEHRR